VKARRHGKIRMSSNAENFTKGECVPRRPGMA
ncbi:hypothetical protein A2U01_0107059, partial [Trifolium medium]|nr:hypothetical protein [Trifolium medium]